MNTIRSKLFFSMGALLFLVAILSYFIPSFFIREDIEKAGGVITQALVKRTPDEKALIKEQMDHLSDQLLKKISLNLLAIALLVFFIALLLLARLSKELTQPISQLAEAANEIGHGHYEQVSFPKKKNPTAEFAQLTHSFEEMVEALKDREKIRGALNKVVSKEIAGEILKSTIELGGEERIVTLFFSDIRNFTPLSSHFAPKVLIEMLNQYMTHMCRIIDKTHGVVDKFVGDEIMALYGAPLELENQADCALEAAAHMMRDLREWNREGKRHPLEIGIGIHTGPVCTGNMGAENRLNYTAIGSNVNLAARMCGVAKPMQILVTQETIDALKNKNRFHFAPIGPIKLKGIEKPILLFEVI